MVDTTKGETGPKTQFNFDVPYMYIACDNTTIDHKEVQIVDYTIVHNWTHLYDAETAHCDARIEFYLIEIYSDKGLIGNMSEYMGTTYNPSYEIGSLDLGDFLGNPNPGGSIYRDLPTGISLTDFASEGRTDWAQAFGEPETIFMNIRRQGWITFNGSSRLPTLASDEEVTKLQFEKYGKGFLHNTVIPEDKLSQIDPFDPYQTIISLATPTPTASPTAYPTPEPTASEPQFNVDVLYAYISVCNSTVYDDEPPYFEKEVPFFNFAIVFNFTNLYDAETANCDIRMEVYLIEIYSDKGLIGKMAESIGTNYTFYQNPSAPYPYVATPIFLSPGLLDDWFGGPPPSGFFSCDWPTGKSEVYSFECGRNDWVQTFEEPECISMSIRREGWVTFNGDSWLATPANDEEVTTLQLEKFGNGFLYNKVVPEDEISQIDLLHPSWSDTPTEGIPPEYTYAAIAIVIIILIELGYALMRRRKQTTNPPFSRPSTFDENFIDLR